MIELLNYSKAYGEHVVLSINSFRLNPGIHLIQGINGSGKTSLFKSIAGIISFHGDCLVHGLSIKDSPVDYRKRVNFCEAEPVFPSFLSGKEIIRFVDKAKNTPERELSRLLNSFNLLDFWHHPINKYSSGMLKKTAHAVAFLGMPKLILLDEPFTTIDQESKRILCDLIIEYHKNGCSFLISAHDNKNNIPLDFHSHLKVDNQTISYV